jgi:hypothetical protein
VLLGSLSAAVDELASVDAGALGDGELGELLVRLRGLQERLDHEAARLTGAWDARKAWAADRARSGASWLAFRARMPHAAAKRQIALGRCLRDMPEADAAWATGEIGGPHVAALSRARTPATADVYARDEAVLVDKARTLRFDDFARVVAYWTQGADPDGVEDDARDVRAQRRLFDGATRRAVEVRDRGRCYHPGCDDTDDLQVDHVQPWSAGGPTIQSNGRLACGHHNRGRNGRSPPHGAG